MGSYASDAMGELAHRAVKLLTNANAAEAREAALRERLGEEVEWLRKQAESSEEVARELGPDGEINAGESSAYEVVADRLQALIEEGGE